MAEQRQKNNVLTREILDLLNDGGWAVTKIEINDQYVYGYDKPSFNLTIIKTQ